MAVMVMMVMAVIMGVAMIVLMIVVMTLERGVAMRRLTLGSRRRAAPVAPQSQKLRGQQIETDHSDHRIAHAFELVRPSVDLKP